MNLVGLLPGQVENMRGPALGKYELRAVQHTQDQPANDVLALAGGTQVAIHQRLVEGLGNSSGWRKSPNRRIW